MDDFESRLSNALGREADHLGAFAGDFADVRRRGRRRQLVVRGAGGFGALVLLGATFALLSTLTEETPQDVSAAGGDATPIAEEPTPTPTSTPVPVDSAAANTNQPQPDPTPAGFGRDEPGTAGGASLLVATGWGVGLVNPLGAQFAPVVCCETDELRWWAQPGLDDGDPALEQGAVTVRDDLRGGLVTASRSVLFWTPSTVAGGDGGVAVLDSAPTRTTAAGTEAEAEADSDETTAPTRPAELDLWDVAEVDGNIHVLYSVVTSGDGGPENRTATLFSVTLDATGAPPEPRALEAGIWSSDDEDWYSYEGASWLPGGGWMTLKSFDQRACSWIDLTSVNNDPSELISPLPRPGDLRNCPYRPVAAAATNDTGTLIAVSQGYMEPNAHLAVYMLSDGQQTHTWNLPTTPTGKGAWTEIDISASGILLSRGKGMDDSQWPEFDETVLADLFTESPGLSRVPFYGAPSFPRAMVPTTGLAGLDLSSPLWFGSSIEIVDSEPEPEGTPTRTPPPATEATPEATPEPGPDPTPEPVGPRRTPTGRLERTVESGQLAGDDGCVTFAGFFTCIGAGYQSAVADADRILGPNTSTDPERQPDDPVPGQAVWLLDDAQFTLANDADSVAQIRISPTTDASPSKAFDGALTIDSVLKTLGAPAVISNTIGEGSHVLWLQYDTTMGFIWYGFTDVGTDDGLLLAAGDITIPDSYLSLPINSYRAQPAG